MHSTNQNISLDTIHASIFNAHSDGILVMDSLGTILTANNAIAALFDYPIEMLLGKNISYLLPELAEQSLAQYQMLGVCFESAAMHRDGHAVPVELTIDLIEDNNQPIFSATVHDNSERKSVELFRERIISTFNHQLRTPLTAIKGSLDIVLAGLTGELPEKAEHHITVANRNSQRLLNVIEDILNPEHSEIEGLSYYFETFDIKNFITNVMDENSAHAQLHEVTLKLNDDIPTGKFFADRVRLTQVMYNLINHATASAPSNSQIEINLSKQFDQVCIAVTNHGKNLSDAQKSALIDKLGETSSDSASLGLTVASAIIQKHQAELKHKNNQDGGTTLYFELPLQ